MFPGRIAAEIETGNQDIENRSFQMAVCMKPLKNKDFTVYICSSEKT